MLVPDPISISMTDGYNLFNNVGQILQLGCFECKSPCSLGHGDKDAELWRVKRMICVCVAQICAVPVDLVGRSERLTKYFVLFCTNIYL